MESIFSLTLWVWIAFLWMPPTWLLMQCLTPKDVVKRYFKRPHFTLGELALFSRFPGSLIRTGIFMNVCTWPKWGRKRELSKIVTFAPSWYVTASKLFVGSAIVHATIMILLFVPLLIYGWWTNAW